MGEPDRVQRQDADPGHETGKQDQGREIVRRRPADADPLGLVEAVDVRRQRPGPHRRDEKRERGQVVELEVVHHEELHECEGGRAADDVGDLQRAPEDRRPAGADPGSGRLDRVVDPRRAERDGPELGVQRVARLVRRLEAGVRLSGARRPGELVRRPGQRADEQHREDERKETSLVAAESPRRA